MPLAGDETDVLALSMRSCGRSFGSRQFASTLLTLLLSFAWRRICRVSSSGPGPSVFAVAGMYRRTFTCLSASVVVRLLALVPASPASPSSLTHLAKTGSFVFIYEPHVSFAPGFASFFFFLFRVLFFFVCLPIGSCLLPIVRSFPQASQIGLIVICRR